MSFAAELAKTRTILRSATQYCKYNLPGHQNDEASCKFVSSHGIIKSCLMFRSGQESMQRPNGTLECVAGSDCDNIYVHTGDICEFSEVMLRKLSRRFALISGNSDEMPGANDHDTAHAKTVLDHPLLDSWYGQNGSLAHEKFRPLPIGLDYHSLASRVIPSSWGGFCSPQQQESMLNGARSMGPKLDEKRLKGYCNWHHVLNRGDRLACINGMELDAIHLEEPKVLRKTSWQNNSNFFFTISPMGNGLDCHRTWEALLLGTVPIVHESAISGLFDNLPVCIVSDWREVTMSYLEQQRSRILASEFDFAPLYLSYWQSRFRGESPPPKRIQSFQAFIDSANIEEF